MNGYVSEIRLQFQISALLDPNMRMTATVANCVAAKLYRRLASISDVVRFFLEEQMTSARCKQYERMAVSKVLYVCKSRRLAPGPCRFADRDAVLRNQLFVGHSWIFSFRNFASDVEDVSATNIRDSKLLDESSDACRLTTILHENSGKSGK